MLKIAHRGASGHAPENSLPAFEKAISLGADMIELDLRQCGSGELVAIHNASLLRLFKIPALVRRKSLAELRALTKNQVGQIPTLEEVLQSVHGRVALNVELKERGSAAQTLRIFREHVGQTWTWEKLFLSSFRHSELLAARRLSPEIQLGILSLTRPFGYKNFAKNIRAKAVIINHRFTSKKLISEIQNAGLEIYVWTVNSLQDIAKFKAWGVDGIISNYPERL